jgi:gentisate 1,2-dioxygenase
MGAYLAMFPKGFKGKDYQSTDGAVFVCVEGHGSTKVGDKVLEWSPNDVFTVPSWHKYAHDVKDEAVLFSISDKPAQEALGIWRERK